MLARDYNSNWMTAVDMLDDDTALGAENGGNLFAARKNTDAASDEDRSRMDVAGEFHVGQFVNRHARTCVFVHIRVHISVCL